MTCTNCKQQAISYKTVIKHGNIYSGCELCLDGLVQGNDNARHYDRERMKRDWAQDLVQPFEKDFAKRYGPEKAREAGWSDASIRKYT